MLKARLDVTMSPVEKFLEAPGVRLRSLGGLLACPFRKDFLQALAIEGKLGACVLSHLFRNFEPVHDHETRILRQHPFAKIRWALGLESNHR